MSGLIPEITSSDSRFATPNYEGEYQKLIENPEQLKDLEVRYLFEMAEQPFAAKDGYAIKNKIYFELIRDHPDATSEDILRVNCREGDLQRRNAKGGDEEAIKKAIEFLEGVNSGILEDTPIDTIAAIKQALTQAYYHGKQLDKAADILRKFCNDVRFKELPPFRRAMMLESLASFHLDLNDTEDAAAAIHDMHGMLIDQNLQPHEVPRAVGGFNHISGDLELKRGRFGLAAEYYNALHTTFNPDLRNQIVGAIRFVQCKILERKTDDPRFSEMGEFVKQKYAQLEPTDFVGLGDAWKFVAEELGIKE